MTKVIISSLVLGCALAALLWIYMDRRWRKPKPARPLALCLDNSGSMHGPGEKWRNSFAKWMLTHCEVGKRTVHVFYFDHEVGESSSYAEGRGVEQHKPPRFANGGTRYDEVLNQALASVGPGGSIVMLTDGMAYPVRPWVDAFNEARRSMGVTVHSLYLIDNDWIQDADRYLKPFSDTVAEAKQQSAPEGIADLIYKETA